MTNSEFVDESESEILCAFFDYLVASNIEYCVVGRSDYLPGEISSDIDIVVSKKALIDMHKTVVAFGQSKLLKVVQMLKHEQTAYYYVLAWIHSDGEAKLLCLDLCSDYYRNGQMFLAADELLCDRRSALDPARNPKGFFLAAPAKEFIYYLLKKIDKEEFNEDEGSHLSANWAMAPSECAIEIERFWSGGNAELLRRASSGDEWEDVCANISTLKRALHAKLFPRSVRSIIREIYRVLYRMLNPTGLHVVFLGPDGSGKSSVIRRVIDDIAPAFRKTAQFHLRPGIGRRKSGSPAANPHAQPVRGELASLVKAAYLLFDYSAGWWISIWPKKIRSTLVIYDRYYHDLLVDPTRYRYGGSMRLANLIGKLLPKPDLWILLDAPAKVLQSRKQEVAIEESARQRDAYLELVNNMGNGIVIDAAQPLDEVVLAVEAAIFDFMVARTGKRLA